MPGLLRDLRPISQSTVGNEPAHLRPGWPQDRATGDGSHVHQESIDQGGAQLYPGSIATATPQTFTVASSPAQLTGFGVDLTSRHRSRTAHRPLSTRFEPAARLRDFNHWFTVVAPSGLACRTRTVWQYQSVPSLSGPLATLPGVPRVRLPPASIGPLRRPDGEGLSPPLDYLAPRGAQSSHATPA
jgi:hypothetical protein